MSKKEKYIEKLKDYPLELIIFSVFTTFFIICFTIGPGTIKNLDNAYYCELLNSDEFYKYINDSLHIDIKNAEEPVYLVVTRDNDEIHAGLSDGTISRADKMSITFISKSPAPKSRNAHDRAILCYENFIVKNNTTGELINLGNINGDSIIAFIPKRYTDNTSILDSLKSLYALRFGRWYAIEIE